VAKKPPRALIGVVLVVGLSGLLAWRVRAQAALRHAPSGGSATIEGVDTVVASKTSGRLVEVAVDQGDKVKAGQVVARLDCADQEAARRAAEARVKAAEVQVAVAEASVAAASRGVAVASAQAEAARAQREAVAAQRANDQADTERTSRLFDAGVVNAVDLDHQRARLDVTRHQSEAAGANVELAARSIAASSASVRTAEAQVAAARAAAETAKSDLARSEVSVKDCTLVAPRDGVVTDRLLEPGAVVGPGTVVVRAVDLSTVKVVFFLPNAELGRVALDAPAEIRADAYPDRVFQGVVRRVAAEAEFTPRNVQTREDRDRLVYAVEVRAPNPDGALRAGMPAEVTIPGTGR
jgi:HlyD family secretion protein